MLFSVKRWLVPALGLLILLPCAVPRPVLDIRDGEIDLREPKDQKSQPLVEWSSSGREGIRKWGLTGTVKESAVKWHEDQVRKKMTTSSALKGQAVKGVIQYVAHTGGSNPHERNHITVSFKNKDEKEIKNNFNGKDNHHIRVRGNGLHPDVKKAWSENNKNLKAKYDARKVYPEQKPKIKTRPKNVGQPQPSSKNSPLHQLERWEAENKQWIAKKRIAQKITKNEFRAKAKQHNENAKKANAKKRGKGHK